jgi:hypothetical protein
MYYKDELQFKKYGYYSVGEHKTLSKFEAWQLSDKKLEKIKFNYNSDLTTQIDWDKKLDLDIEDYYRLRAEQLRNDYDYLVLLYSGGIDSHVILETFLKNKIKLDEIISVGNRKYLSLDAKFNQEIFKTAIPYVEKIDLSSIGAIFNYVDIGQLIIDQFDKTEDIEKFFYLNNGGSNLWSYALRGEKFKLLNKHHLTLSESGKKICYIWGFDKPYLNIENNKRVTAFFDNIADLGPKQYYNRNIIGGALANFYDEPFFICREMLSITVKQVQLIEDTMKYFFTNDDRLCYFHDLGNTGPFVRYSDLRWMKKKELEKIIYPNATHDMFGNDKIKGSVMFTPRDRWFWSSTHPNRNRLVDYFKKILKENEEFFYYKPGNIVINTVPISSESIVIGSILN